MKTKINQFVSPFKKNLLPGFFLLCGLLLSGYKSSACTASFTYNAGVNGHYTFTSTSIGVNPQTIYTWNPGDGSGWHYGTPAFAHTYTANATYNARLAIYDSNSCNDTVTVPITVSNVTVPCLLSARFNVTYGAGGQVTFTSTSGGVNANTLYYWAPGDSNRRFQAPSSFTHKYLWDGNYTAWLTIEDTGNAYCIDSVPAYIAVRNADSTPCHFHANFTYTIGPNGKVTFTNTSVGQNAWYYWNMGDTAGYFYYDTSVVYTYAYNGTYNVKLVMTSNDSSFCTDTIIIPVTVTNACDIHASFTYVYDSNGGVTFTSTSAGVNGSTVYKWTFGDGSPTQIGDDTITHDYSFIGYYNVTLTITDTGGCTSSSNQQIYIYNKDSLQACFTYTADSLNPGTYNFTSVCSKGTNGNTYYKWTPGDGDPSDSALGMTTYTHTYLNNGPYSATLTIWYTILPHKFGSSPEYDKSSYTLVINVTGATGITSIKDAGSYTIYPNPNNGSFNIAVNGLANEKNAVIRISNMMGQVIYQFNQAVTGGSTLTNISLPNAASGIYLLQIITNDNTYTSRIAIQK